MASHNRQRSSVDRSPVESRLTSGAADQAAATPNRHVTASPNREYFPMSAHPRPPVKHTRALSYTPRRPNRLSLSFPVAPSKNSESDRPTPTSSNAPSLPTTPAEMVPTPTLNDADEFLVTLAGQERRVLELKEELKKAEADLFKLKKQWAYHGAHKKRAEIRHGEPLHLLQTNVTEGGRANKEAGSTTRQSIELDRRKALFSNVPKEPRRKVLVGGHTRALSLLSPDRLNYSQPFPPVHESGSESDTSSLPRSTTMPDTCHGITKSSLNRARHSYQGGVTHGAKQIAEDVKAGLWTFLEDLRQATVGDEAVNGTTNRGTLDGHIGPTKKGSRNSLLNNERGRRTQSSRPDLSPPRTWDSLTGSDPAALLDAAGTLWPEMDHPRTAPRTPAASKQKPGRTLSLAPAVDELDDDWSNWDSPTPKSPRWSGSTDLSDPATPSNGSSDDRAVQIADQLADCSSAPSNGDEIVWPGLDKLTPGNLKRTVSTMMKELEKSLTPQPGVTAEKRRSMSIPPPVM